MKPIPGFDALLARATDKGLFGTKMRSVIKLANDAGVKAVVDRQFDLGRQILAAGLVPIIEPEIDFHSPQKAEAEALLKAAILEQLGQLGSDQCVMLELTLPRARRLLCGPGDPLQRGAGCRRVGRLPPRGGQRPS
jgi:fructose-bisphosphate aldolase class I